ncbi:MAG: hypothetical protein WCS82_02530 [Candidatus Riflebacteria bacterium]
MSKLLQTKKNQVFFRLFLLLISFGFPINLFAGSVCVKYDKVNGNGDFPFNFRVIDNKFCAGGTLFNPITKQGNSKLKVLDHLRMLKKMGVKTIITLNVPLTDKVTPLLSELCEQEALEHIKIRMTANEIPNEHQTQLIMNRIENGAYVHCMWGCDRTGAIIAMYLRLKHNYSGEDAYKAVIKGGSHSGKMGGFKEIASNNKLIRYFWNNGIQF